MTVHLSGDPSERVEPPPVGATGRRIAVVLAGCLVLVAGVAGVVTLVTARDPGAPPDVVLTGARSGERIGTTVAVYAEIENRGGADRLLRATSPVASRALVHSTDEVGIMRTAEGFELPGGTTVRLQPGGTHLMLEGVGRDLRPGDRFPVRLELERTGPIEVEVEVVALEELVEVEQP